MKTQQKWLMYAELELITPVQPKARNPLVLGLVLRNLWNSVLTLMAGNEPRIRQTIDTEGKIWWHIEDRTGRSITCESEQEVRIWLERHLF